MGHVPILLQHLKYDADRHAAVHVLPIFSWSVPGHARETPTQSFSDTPL